MAKSSGLGAGLWVSGYDLSGDTQAVNTVRGGTSPLPFTGINKSAMERKQGVMDAEINISSFFNDATDAAHGVYSTLPTANRIVTYAHRSAAIGDVAASLLAKQIGYDPTRAQDGSFLFTVQGLSNTYTLEWGELLTPGIAEITGAGAQASLDYGAGIGSTSFGLQAYLHVFAFTGTDATIAVQESSDDGAVDTFANVTGGVFTEVATLGGANTSERIQTGRTATIERYLRVNVTTSAGFSDLHFAVQVVKNEASVVF